MILDSTILQSGHCGLLWMFRKMVRTVSDDTKDPWLSSTLRLHNLTSSHLDFVLTFAYGTPQGRRKGTNI
jgi:hypothetical protein